MEKSQLCNSSAFLILFIEFAGVDAANIVRILSNWVKRALTWAAAASAPWPFWKSLPYIRSIGNGNWRNVIVTFAPFNNLDPNGLTNALAHYRHDSLWRSDNCWYRKSSTDVFIACVRVFIARDSIWYSSVAEMISII